MAIKDRRGILRHSNEGGCLNYDPDKDSPTSRRAYDIEGLEIYICLNCEQTDEGIEISCFCGDARFCSMYAPIKQRRNFTQPANP